jgi:Matrixin
MAPLKPTSNFQPGYFDVLFGKHPNQRWPETKRELLVHLATDKKTAGVVLEGARLWTPALGTKLTFRAVSVPEIADIRLVFAKTVLGDSGLGESQITYEVRGEDPSAGDGILTGARITLRAGLTEVLLRLTAAHEFGHILGLVGRSAALPSHSPNKADLMSGIVRSRSAVTQRDINTLAQLYSLPRPALRARPKGHVIRTRLTRRGCEGR